MPKTTRTTDPRDMTGIAFYDIDEFSVISFCPDSRDASTPAKQVHVIVQLKESPGSLESKPLPMVMRYHGPGSLDAHIEAMIEHRTYVFGRKQWRNDWPEQDKMPEYDEPGGK